MRSFQQLLRRALILLPAKKKMARSKVRALPETLNAKLLLAVKEVHVWTSAQASVTGKGPSAFAPRVSQTRGAPCFRTLPSLNDDLVKGRAYSPSRQAQTPHIHMTSTVQREVGLILLSTRRCRERCTLCIQTSEELGVGLWGWAVELVKCLAEVVSQIDERELLLVEICAAVGGCT